MSRAGRGQRNTNPRRLEHGRLARIAAFNACRPVILRCEWRDAKHRAGSLEGCTAELAAGPSPFEGR
jgi:hypothetical protein